MTLRRALGALAVVVAGLGVAQPVAQAAPVRAPENPVGAAVSIASTSVAPGGPIAFTGTGFVRADGAGGQIVTIKLDDVTILGTFPADATGAVSGTVAAPADPGEHWLRFLAGSGGSTGGPAQPPPRSLVADFSVLAPAPAPGEPAPAPPATTTPAARVASGTLHARNGRVAVRLALDGTVSTAATVTVRSAARVRVGHRRARVAITRRALVSLPAGTPVVKRLALTRTARALLGRRATLRVVVAVRPLVGDPGRRTVTLRR